VTLERREAFDRCLNELISIVKSVNVVSSISSDEEIGKPRDQAVKKNYDSRLKKFRDVLRECGGIYGNRDYTFLHGFASLQMLWYMFCQTWSFIYYVADLYPKLKALTDQYRRTTGDVGNFMGKNVQMTNCAPGYTTAKIDPPGDIIFDIMEEDDAIHRDARRYADELYERYKTTMEAAATEMIRPGDPDISKWLSALWCFVGIIPEPDGCPQFQGTTPAFLFVQDNIRTWFSNFKKTWGTA